MVLLGTTVNACTIILGATVGSLLKRGLPENIKSTVLQGVTLTVILIGLKMAFEAQRILIVALSLVSGGFIGELLKIEDHLNRWGQALENSWGQGDKDFARGFVSASLIFCVGAMAIMGSLESGLTGQHTTLLVKSLLDGVTSMILASSLGWGVAFSAIPVFLYQGSIALAAGKLSPLLNEGVIREMTATGGLLILAIGLNLLDSRFKIKVGNLLPALFMAALWVYLAMGWQGGR
ncbi:MAG TPA: DUF554 domain-containing protein [Moorella mulderi]|nr:DUF554 domain-containing protein [Moorella mulderi]